MMASLTTPDLLKRAVAWRDPRYDGRFYYGVRCTRIYCRPVCPARPNPGNIVLFKSASAAEAAGYRACLRCRPDRGPASASIDGPGSVVSRALKLIQNAAPENVDIPSLADALGVTDRHLRRLFDQELGASPVDILVTQRLHLAKQMVDETSRPITDVAYAVGFQSIRRFNEAFKKRYRLSPREARQRAKPERSGELTLRIPIRLPYDWTTVLSYLRRHEGYGLERIQSETYERFWVRGRSIGVITVSYTPTHHCLLATFDRVALHDLREVLRRLKIVFDTDHNPAHLPEHRIKSRGIRVPGAFEPFETAISILLSQRVSAAHAKATFKKLICRYGALIGDYQGQPVYQFPTPKQLLRLHIKPLGIPRTLGRAIQAMSKAVVDGTIRFEAHRDPLEERDRLLELHGIGPWTATMIAMRCFGDADAFPDNDLVIAREVASQKVDASEWPLSRAYLTHCLWRDYADRAKPTRKTQEGIP